MGLNISDLHKRKMKEDKTDSMLWLGCKNLENIDRG